jgi:hypothetical protein
MLRRDCAIVISHATERVVCDVAVVHNTIVSAIGAHSSIEYRFDRTTAKTLNNLVTEDILVRDDAGAPVAGNISGVALNNFVDPLGGDLHLVSGSEAIDAGVNLGEDASPHDIDGDVRAEAPDVGADEVRSWTISLNRTASGTTSLNMRIHAVGVLFLFAPTLACDEGGGDSLEQVVADLDEATLQVAAAECDSACATASPLSSCGATPDVSDEPTEPCTLDALALDADAVRAWTGCWVAVETEYTDCLLAPACAETSDYSDCGDAREVGHDACGDLPIEVEDALEVCEGERDDEEE